MLVHTRSIWISIVGLIQIILSFPLAYFVYTFIARLDFFPFLNFIGVFVLFALGSDDVFVAMDKWKNARIDNRNGSVEDIAAVALPDAAAAMFLTSITTSVAFFSTAISPVAPLKCFAVFCGLLIVFAYLMCVVLVFPALCIYDRWLLRGPRFICSFHCFTKKEEVIDDYAPDDTRPSMIRRILNAFYVGFHKVRWFILAASVAATIISAIFAAQLKQPTSSDVRLLTSSLMYEQAYEWRLHSLYTVIGKSGGAPGYVIWGVTPADTGTLTNPASWTQLVLDETFDPSSIESQTYLLNFCERFFAEDFAGYTEDGYMCGMNSFDVWLKSESNATNSSAPYTEHCEGATGLPMAVAAFNPCISAWASTTSDVSILLKDGVVKVIFIEFQQRIRFDSPYDQLNNEWNALESWLTAERADAPAGVNKMYHSSADFWWYDTNGNMLQAAYSSAAISLAFAAVVVFFASRSLLLTFFCVLTIGFILTSTTALLVASGWTLGFLESICFAILIGISCDFVLHFSHAYAYLPGSVSRHERSKYALIRMGPSVLASAFTTICGAVLMIFCVISFFRKFAQILFYTILMATVGSFVVFLSLADSIGPSRPTYIYDKIAERCCPKEEARQLDDGEYNAGETMSERKEVEVASESYLPDDVSVEA
jgi:predicted RND superfamily exporter protein